MPKIFFGNNGSRGVIYDKEDIANIPILLLIIGIAGIIITILTAIAIFLSQLTILFYTVVREITHSIYDFIIIKIITFPSTLDIFFGILKTNHFLKVILFITLIYVLYNLHKRIPQNKYIFIDYYILFNIIILSVRIIFSIVIGFVSIFIGSDAVNSDKYTLTEYKIKETINENYSEKNLYFYTEEELKNGEVFTDANNNKVENHKSVMWVAFGKDVSQQNKQGTYAFDYVIDGFYYKSPAEMDRFKTILSYAPITEDMEYTNKSTFKIQFIGDGKTLKTYTLSPQNSVIKVDFPINVNESFGVKINGDVKDYSILTMLGTSFINEY